MIDKMGGGGGGRGGGGGGGCHSILRLFAGHHKGSLLQSAESSAATQTVQCVSSMNDAAAAEVLADQQLRL